MDAQGVAVAVAVGQFTHGVGMGHLHCWNDEVLHAGCAGMGAHCVHVGSELGGVEVAVGVDPRVGHDGMIPQGGAEWRCACAEGGSRAHTPASALRKKHRHKNYAAESSRPATSLSTRSHRAAKVSSCVTITNAVPCSRASCSMCWNTPSAVVRSRLPVGSSAS